MNDEAVVLRMMVLAMIQTMEAARSDGTSRIVSFAIEGGTGCIAPVVENVGSVYAGQWLGNGPRVVGQFNP